MEGKFIEVTPRQKIFWHSPVIIDIRFQNTGNVHIKPIGVISIQNSSGGKVDNLEFNTNGANTLPNSIRHYELAWKPKKLLGFIPAFGSYSIKPLIGFGNPLVLDKNLGSISFFLLPIELVKTVAIAVFICTFLFFGVFKAGQRRGRRRRRR